MVLWGILAAFVGLKGIQYVAKVATYLPLIPLVILLLLVASRPSAASAASTPAALVATQQDRRTRTPAACSDVGRAGVHADLRRRLLRHGRRGRRGLRH